MNKQPLIKHLLQRPVSQMGLVSGSLSLDYTNTLAWRISAQPQERLHHYDDLLAWGLYVEQLDPKTVEQLEQLSQKNKKAAQQEFTQAIVLRELLRRIFYAASVDVAPKADDLEAVRVAYGETIANATLFHDGTKYIWRMRADKLTLGMMRHHVVLSAVELLGSPLLSRVTECKGDGCGFLLLDQTRNHSRRWCTSEVCGNRERVRRHYARTQKGKSKVHQQE